MSTVSPASELIARLESVPFSKWHLRARIVMGSATFFDAFDALALAFVLPVLVRQWGISSQQIGWLISVGPIIRPSNTTLTSVFMSAMSPLQWNGARARTPPRMFWVRRGPRPSNIHTRPSSPPSG